MGQEWKIDPKDIPYERDYPLLPLIDKDHPDRERLMAEAQERIQERRRRIAERLAQRKREQAQQKD